MRPEARSVGGYTLLERLGAGGNGEVFRAQRNGEHVAIKLLKRQVRKDAEPRFVREIAALEKLRGMRGVLPLLDHGKEPHPNGQRWFTMPLAVTLSDALSQTDLRGVCAAMAEIASALGRVHRAGICHRDIKPDNLYLYDGTWCLGDFGLADFEGAESITQSGRKLGPAYFIAPEMLNDPQTADGFAADVYSFGKCIWVLATGQNYPMPGVHDPSFAAVSVKSAWNDWRSGPLDELLIRMSELDPKLRPPVEAAASELRLLSKEDVEPSIPDPVTALSLLRSTLVPHRNLKAEEERQRSVAAALAEKLRTAVREVADVLATGTNEELQEFHDFPRYWAPSPSQQHQVLWTDALGLAMEAGGDRIQWRMGVGFQCHLFKDSQVDIRIGYSFDRLVFGQEANHMGMPHGWEAQVGGENGVAATSIEVERIITELRSNLPAMVELYTRLVGEASS